METTPTNDLTETNLGQAELPVSEHLLSRVFRYVYDIIKTAVFVLVFALVVRSFLIQPFIVDGSSMEPTFHDQEYLMVEKLGTTIKKPTRGDIIVFRYPLQPSLNYVKRIIGVPGDRVVIGGGKVTVYNNANPSGLVLKEHYLSNNTQTLVRNELVEHSWVVNNDGYFVMGDNRDHSDDSRSWGLVPGKNVIGKVWITVYPLANFGLIEHAEY